MLILKKKKKLTMDFVSNTPLTFLRDFALNM